MADLLYLFAAALLLGGSACNRSASHEDRAAQRPSAPQSSTPAVAPTKPTSEPSTPSAASKSAVATNAKPAPGVPEAVFTIVFDNGPSDAGLASGWGFACLVDAGNRHVLFDAGNDERAVVGNLKRLGRAPEAVGPVVISHAHGDHTRGLWALLERGKGTRVYLPQGAAGALAERVRAAGGVTESVAHPTEIGGGLQVTGPLGGPIAEQALLVSTPRGTVMVVGCSHPGIEQMLDRAAEIVESDKLFGIIGGMHLHGAGPARLRRVVEAVRKHDLGLVAPAHCTGAAASAKLRAAFPEAFRAVRTGSSLRLGG